MGTGMFGRDGQPGGLAVTRRGLVAAAALGMGALGVGAAAAFASEPPSGGSGGAGGPGGEPPSGGPGGEPPAGGPGAEAAVAGQGTSVNAQGVVSVVSGEPAVSDDAYAASVSVSADGAVAVEGVSVASEDYGYTFLSASGSDVALRNASVALGVGSPVESGATAGTAAYIDSGTLRVQDSDLSVDGAGRYTVAAEGTATMVVEDSTVTAGGDLGAGGNTSAISAPASNAGLLISGTSRANFSVGQTHTFYYGSTCVAEGWAALSTDSATGTGLEFVGYDTDAVALHGGYGIYADTNCRDYLFGCSLVSAEVGAIISNNGSIAVGPASAAAAAQTQDGLPALGYLAGEALAQERRSSVTAARNCFQLHSPDMMGEGSSDYAAQLSLASCDLVTLGLGRGESYEYASPVSGQAYEVAPTEDYAAAYGDAVGAYIDFVRGSAILAKSTSADILLEDVTVSASNGVAVMSVPNSDLMSRYLKQDVGAGVSVRIVGSAIEGSFVHDDFQRPMDIVAEGSTIAGDIDYTTYDEWNALWADFAGDESCTWYGLDAATYVTDAHPTTLTLAGGSTWAPAGASRLTRLTVSADSTVMGTITAASTSTAEDGSTVYEDVTVTA